MATKAFIESAVSAAPLSSCMIGRHRPRRVAIRAAGGLATTTCRDCGCRLTRTLATRRWVYSGELS